VSADAVVRRSVLARRTTARRVLDAVLRTVARVSLWQYFFGVLVVWWTVYFTRLSIDVHQGLGTSSYDVGLYDQGVWLMSRFKAPFVTLMGRNLMGDHTSFVLVLLVPVYWIWPSINALFLAQSLAIALTGLPVFLLARRRLGSEGIALLLAACTMLHPALGWTNRENFHPDAFVAFFVGMAIYGALERRWRIYVVFVVLSLLVKEDVSFVIVPLGIWVALRRDRRLGLLTIGGSLAFMLFAMYVVMRSLIGVPTRNGWRIPFGGPTGFITETIERPGNVFDHMRSDGRPFYLWQMTFPMGWVFARAPSVALISLTVVLSNMASTYWYQYHIDYHYSLVAVPAIAMGTVYALGYIRGNARRWALAGVAVSSLWAAIMWGAVPVGSILCTPQRIVGAACTGLGKPQGGYWLPNEPSPVAARKLMAEIPDDAVVSAFHALTPHLSHRELIYQFPNPFRVVLYGPDEKREQARARLPQADLVQYVMLPVTLDAEAQTDWDAVKGEFTTKDSNDFWVLYQRRT
jgi:uncharacterized membrane protein